MSICVYCRVKEKRITPEILEKVIRSFRFFQNDFIKEINSRCIVYEDIKDDVEIVSFISEKNFPYNIYDSNIMGEYKYTQLLVFDIRKDRALKDEYEKIIRFCVHLKKETNSEMLLTSDVYDDICFLEGKNVIWSETFPSKFDIKDL